MLYRIAIPKYGISETRKRADSAQLCAERAAYRAIKADGALDTLRGRTAMARVRAGDPRKGYTVEVCGAFLYVTPSH